MESHNAEIVRKMYQDFDRGDLDAVLDAMAPNVVFHAPGGAPFSGRKMGRDQVLERFREVRKLVQIDEFDVDEILADKDKVVALGRQRATVRATGRHFEQEFAHVYAMRGGKVIAVHLFGDTYAVASAFNESPEEQRALTGSLGVTHPPFSGSSE
jgi:ketosteroid isomerase-like protein